MKITELAGMICLSQATVTDFLIRLDTKGYIKRSRSNRDKRRLHITFTGKAIRVLAKKPSFLPKNFMDNFKELKLWKQSLI